MWTIDVLFVLVWHRLIRAGILQTVLFLYTYAFSWQSFISLEADDYKKT